MKKFTLLTILIASLLLVACAAIPQPSPFSITAVPTAETEVAATATTALEMEIDEATALNVESLQNVTISGIYEEPVTLIDGHWEGEPYVEGGASRPIVDYMGDSALFGDLDGDGLEDAVFFLVESGGGSGSFVYVAAQLNRDGKPVDAGAVLIEDRIQIKSAAIETGQIQVEAIVPGPGDGACCPSHKENKLYALQDGMLAEVTPEGGELVKVSAMDLDGTAWTLKALAEGQPVLEDTEITIRFEEGAISGSAGCTNYTSAYELSEDNPFLITLEPVNATRMACPDPVMDQETTYLSALEAVTIWGYRFGDLVLRYMTADGTPALLAFAPAGAVAMADDGEGAMAGAPLPPAEIANDEGGVEVVTGDFNYTSYTVERRMRDNVIGLLNAKTIIERDNTTFVGSEDQILGRVIGPISPSPISYQILLPIDPPGPSIDVDNDGEEDAGVRVYHVAIGPDFYGSNYMDAIEQDYFKSWLRDQATGAITAANLLIFAPDDVQGFPADAGDDGFYFTEDDTIVSLPAGYTVAMLGNDGVVTFDRSRQASVDVLESASASSPDFSDQGILESYNSLIDMLANRYAYTELRGLDWEAIRETYLPQVEAADDIQEFADYYIALRQMAESIGDAHVQVIGVQYSGSYLALKDELLGANLGAQLVELDDGRFIITYIDPDGPAAEGWQFGTEIISVDGVPIEEHVKSRPYFQSLGTPETVRLARVANALRYPQGSTTTIEYILPGENALRRATLTAVFGFNDVLPRETPPEFEWRRLEGGVGYISWKNFTNLGYENASLVNALDTFGPGVPGIMLDLRGNGGGNVGLYFALSSYFFTPDDPGSMGWIDEYFYDPSVGEQVKTFEAAFPIYSPRPDLTYSGPLVVLVDNHSASAGEYMPQFLQTEGRAVVVGEHSTEGAGGTVQRASLPGGLGLQFTQGRTTFAGTDELNLEAKGVTLDVEVPITEENERAKLEGIDVVLNAGLEALADAGAQLAGQILPGTTWQLIQQTGLTSPAGEIENPGAYTLTFGEAGEQTVTIQADCNTVNAEYTLGAGTITITLGPSTLAECPSGSLSEPFLEALSEASGIEIDPQGSALVITSGELSLQAMLFAPADGDLEE